MRQLSIARIAIIFFACGGDESDHMSDQKNDHDDVDHTSTVSSQTPRPENSEVYTEEFSQTVSVGQPNTNLGSPFLRPSGGINKRVIVIFIHWLDDPYKSRISSRSTLDAEMDKAAAKFLEFSSGRFRLWYDVCETNADIPRPDDGSELIASAIALCDPEVNYNNYDWIVFYPGNSFQAGEHAVRFTTDDSETGILRKTWIGIGHISFSSDSLLHEGGHALGLEHAHSVDCGEYVFGPGCAQDDDYGDYFDTMGYSKGHYNCAYKEQLGWLPAPPITHESGDASYVIPAVEVPTTMPNCIKVVIDDARTRGIFTDYRVSNPCDNLYIEYRKPINHDEEWSARAPGADWLALHCATSEPPETRYREDGTAFIGGGTHSWILDCTPNSRSEHDSLDALLPPGVTCDTGLGYAVSFTVLLDNQALVRISPTPDAELPTSP